MDNIDIKLLNLLKQENYIETGNLKAIAKDIMLTEEEIIYRINRLKKDESIEELDKLNLKEMQWSSTLCAMSIPEHKVIKVAQIINEYDEVSYSCIREHYYNMWFTIIAKGEDNLDKIINNIKKDTKINTLINLPLIKIFNINSKSDLNDKGISHNSKLYFKSSAMIVWDIDRKSIDHVGKLLSNIPEVTYCAYRQGCEEWKYSLYVMLCTENRYDCEELIRNISNKIGIKSYKILYGVKELKL